MLRVCLSQVSASPSAEKGLAILVNLSRPCPVVGASLEALSLMRSIPLPWGRARGAPCKTACAQFKGKVNASPLARSLRGVGVLGQRASRPLANPTGTTGILPVAAAPGTQTFNFPKSRLVLGRGMGMLIDDSIFWWMATGKNPTCIRNRHGL